ncbi:MAG: hypothetical protein CL728_04745 [Chloroflexi bacterium]|nr:hypothetical protein [Chloroflexota bacterium]
MDLYEEVSNAFCKHKVHNNYKVDGLVQAFEVYDVKNFENRLRSTYVCLKNSDRRKFVDVAAQDFLNKSESIAIYNNPLTEDRENDLQNMLNMYIEFKVKYLVRTYDNVNKIHRRTEKKVEVDEEMIKSIINLNYKSKAELEKRKCDKFLLKPEDLPFKSLSITQQRPTVIEKPKIKQEVEICRCPAITLKGIVCGAKLKGDNEFCLRHLKK